MNENTELTKIVYVHKDTNTYYANSLRRIMMSDIETLAIDTVDIVSNISLLTDEILVHRLGLIVINSNSLYNEGNEVIEEFTFTLNVICTDDSLTLTADMIETNHPDVYPVHGDIVIAQLYKGDQINLSGKIRKGIGRNHAKWMPVATIGYSIKHIENTENNDIEIYMIIESVGSLSANTILELGKGLIKTLNGKITDELYMNKFKRAYLL